MTSVRMLDHPLAAGCPPRWASAWGEDNVGPWVDLTVKRVSQRLRWIPPGKFMMGVAANEDHFFWETVGQREITITKGFWLFDTPCTQALWVAVMGDNPSYFRGDRRPVDSISWEECQHFVEKLNGLVSGLHAGLPSEAQWEYACRARTTTVLYHDDIDLIAWYDKNSDGETHEVAGKLANDWGLYDMLGNVWEWCHDKFNPSEQSSSANRVFRGGSFLYDAQDVRAAYRDGLHPGNRYRALGFRCCSLGSELIEG